MYKSNVKNLFNNNKYVTSISQKSIIFKEIRCCILVKSIREINIKKIYSEIKKKECMEWFTSLRNYGILGKSIGQTHGRRE